MRFFDRQRRSERAQIEDNITPTVEMEDFVTEFHSRKHGIFFVTGEAGTGKSTLLRKFYQQEKTRAVCVAPTGIAALNISGQTIHSFFKFPPSLINPAEVKKQKDPRIYQKIDFLIIDEVSMLRPDLVDAIDVSLKMNRNCSELPFGGVTVILFGDLYQLPPVVEDGERNILKEMGYRTRYFFSAMAFKENIAQVKMCRLTKVFRQHSDSFINLLNQVRNCELTDEIGRLLDSRLIDEEDAKLTDALVLTTTNKVANAYNQDFLDELPGNSKVFRAKVTGDFKKQEYPTEEYLELKKDAKILFIKNDEGNRWINGSIGIVSGLDADKLLVKVGDLTHRLKQVKWCKFRYSLAEGKIVKEEIGSFEQFPVRLGWAITIHKSQGLTLDQIVIDTRKKAFESGQVYVALSRVREIDAISLIGSITGGDIWQNNEVADFEEYMNEKGF